MCESCAPEHEAEHEAAPLDVVAEYIERAADVAKEVSTGVRTIQRGLSSALGLFGASVKGRKRKKQ